MPETWPFPWGKRTFIMGVLNVTPDSFSGDGLIGSEQSPSEKTREIEAGGADLLDIGGESTRPHHELVPADVELERVLPALRTARPAISLPISIDTRKAEVARQALTAGATVVNDVSGLVDPQMADVVASFGAGLIVVHDKRPPEGLDLMTSIIGGLEEITDRAIRVGVRGSAIAVDPGLGFGKNWRQNLEIMKRLSELRSLGYPIVIGPSRKATISHVLGVGTQDRLEGTAAFVAIGVANGADVVRVHDVHFMHEVTRMTDLLAR